jgi:hypothetical protein
MEFHQPLLGKPLGESGQGGGACHGSSPLGAPDAAAFRPLWARNRGSPASHA